jgi:photosystem II stability/assembly factor-like uncharacterized protein
MTSLLIPIGVTSLFAQEDGFTETFDNPELPGWEHSPNAFVQEGVLRMETNGFLFRSVEMENAEITLRMRLEGDGDLEIQYRSTDSSGYSFIYSNERFILLRFKDGIEKELKSINREFHHTEWAHVMINTSGGEQFISVADEAEFGALDTAPLPPGGFLIRVRGDAIGEFDDIRIIDLEGDPSAPDEIPPSSSEELPSTTDGGPAYQSIPWVYTGGPSGGLGYDIRMHPDNPDIMFVSDANAGVFKSTDGGLTWTPKNNGIGARMGPAGDHVPVFSLTIDPNDPDRIWIGTQYSSGIYRSDDGGENWNLMNKGVIETAISVRGFSVEPGNSDIVYMAGEVSSWEWNLEPLPGLGLDMTKGVVYKTTDGGENWQRIWLGDNLARYIWIHPENHNLIYISTGIFDREAANSDPNSHDIGGVGVLRSRDGGKTWDVLNEANGFAHEDLYIGSLFMHPENPSILLAAAGNDPYGPAGGIYITEDGGDHWTETLDSHNMSLVEICEADPNVVYAGSLGAFFRSLDGGRTWKNLTPETGMWGPPDVPAGFPIDAQCDPRDPMRLFVNNYVGGNFLSQDGGESWINSSTGYTGAMMGQIAIVQNDPARLFVSARSGLFATDDGGNNWHGLSCGAARTLEGLAIAVDPSNPSHLLATLIDAGPEPKVSWDGGKTWDIVRTGLWGAGKDPGGMMTQIEFVPSNPRIVLASVGPHGCWLSLNCDEPVGGGIIRSTDGGKTWEKTDLSHGNVLDFDVASTDNALWYATVYDRGIFRSTDFGETWLLINSNPIPKTINTQIQDQDMLPEVAITSIKVDLSDVNKLFAGISRGGIMISLDGGETWEASSIGLPPEASVRDLAQDPTNKNILYAASPDSGVFLSTDGGQKWTDLNNGLTNRAAEQLAISADGRVLYVSTEGAGVFRLGTPPLSTSLSPTPEEEIEVTEPATEEPRELDVATPEMDQIDEPEERQKGFPFLPGCLQSSLPLIIIGLIGFSRWFKRKQNPI